MSQAEVLAERFRCERIVTSVLEKIFGVRDNGLGATAFTFALIGAEANDNILDQIREPAELPSLDLTNLIARALCEIQERTDNGCGNDDEAAAIAAALVAADYRQGPAPLTGDEVALLRHVAKHLEARKYGRAEAYINRLRAIADRFPKSGATP